MRLKMGLINEIKKREVWNKDELLAMIDDLYFLGKFKDGFYEMNDNSYSSYTEDIYEHIFDDGYFNPKKYLKNDEDIRNVTTAIATVLHYIDSLKIHGKLDTPDCCEFEHDFYDFHGEED